MNLSNIFPIDASSASRARLALGIVLLMSAISNLLWEPTSMSSGRWSWLFQTISTTFGVYGWPAIKALLGVLAIASSRKSSNQSRK
jgi:hypothetical protein